jgi:hypothetical protein
MFDMLLKSLGLSQDQVNQYMAGLANTVNEIKAGISGLITSNASIIARLEAIEAKLTAANSKDENHE